MKKLIYFLAVLILMCFSCESGNKSSESSESQDSTQIDTLLAAFKKIDSLKNNGQLFHLDIFEIGKLGSIYFDVYKVTCGDESAQYINLKKDCGGQYYYDWEDAILVQGEIKYLLSAVDTVLSNFDRPCNHEERYIYITKDDIRLFSSAWENRKWSASLSVDYHKKDASVSLDKEGLNKLKDLLKKGNETIDSLVQKSDTSVVIAK